MPITGCGLSAAGARLAGSEHIAAAMHVDEEPVAVCLRDFVRRDFEDFNAGDLTRLDAAFFTMNGVISLTFFGFVLVERLVR